VNTQNFYRLFLPVLCLAVTLTLTMGSVHASQIQQTGTDFAAIDTYIQEQMDNLGIPGMAMGIIQDGQIAHVQGFGIADSTGRAVTPQTPFYIGSVTKSFTALAVMQLVEDGKIDLDATVQTYLPWFTLADKDASAKITVRHLLTQTTGIAEKEGNRVWASQLELEEQVRQLDMIKLSHPVGSTYEYCNLNYMIAGLIVEKASGQSYADYVTENIFEPLEMVHSYASREPARADGLAQGHIYIFGRVFSDDGPMPPAILPAGALSASVEDLSQYAIAHLNEGRYQDKSIVSPQGMAELHAPAISQGGEGYYAMGWNVGNADGISYLVHAGDAGRNHAIVILMPDRNSGLILLSNASGFVQSEQVNDMGRELFYLLNGKPAASVTLPLSLQLQYGGLLLTPLLQILGIIFVWLKRQRINVLGFLLTIILNLAVVFSLFGFSLSRMPLPSMLVFDPDIGYALVIIAVLGIGWSVIFTTMFLMRRRLK
jgi:CubicO group peptidase (beta-lactamase class C family)